MFTLVDHGSNNRYAIPAKSADESTVRLLFDNYEQELHIVYTDGFRAYSPLDDDNTFDRDTSSTATVNTLMKTFTSTPARATDRCCDRGSHPIEAYQKTS